MYDTYICHMYDIYIYNMTYVCVIYMYICPKAFVLSTVFLC